MIFRRLSGFVNFVISLVVIGVAVELVGLYFYLKWTTEVTVKTHLTTLLADGVTTTEVVGFLTATPDRAVVVVFLAVMSVFVVLNRKRIVMLLNIIDGGGSHGGGGGGGFGGG